MAVAAKCLAMTLALMVPALAQAQPSPAPKTDLSGVWTNSSVTQLTRPASRPLVVSEAEAKTLGDASFWVRSMERERRPSDLNDNLLADGNVSQGYNASWLDPGATVARVGGEYRTSWLVEPANGQLPLTDAGREAARLAPRRQRATDNVEAMAPGDRCLIATRGSGGPGMLNNIYNNNYQIVQTPTHVVIVVEMVHDARIVPLFASKAAAQAGHRPPQIRPWLGDSVGWWEGQTLVVETTNLHPDQGAYGPIFLSDKGRVTERFRRAAPDEIFYAFEVEDPVYYTQPWRAEMTLKAAPGPLYEYACHEGNYALEGMLAGARAEEARASTAAATR